MQSVCLLEWNVFIFHGSWWLEIAKALSQPEPFFPSPSPLCRLSSTALLVFIFIFHPQLKVALSFFCRIGRTQNKALMERRAGLNRMQHLCSFVEWFKFSLQYVLSMPELMTSSPCICFKGHPECWARGNYISWFQCHPAFISALLWPCWPQNSSGARSSVGHWWQSRHSGGCTLGLQEKKKPSFYFFLYTQLYLAMKNSSMVT